MKIIKRYFKISAITLAISFLITCCGSKKHSKCDAYGNKAGSVNKEYKNG